MWVKYTVALPLIVGRTEKWQLGRGGSDLFHTMNRYNK